MTETTAPRTVPTMSAVFNIAWPLALRAMMLHGIIVIDAWLVSALGDPAVAALGLAGSFGGLLLGFQIAFSNATQIRVAQAFGSGSEVALKTAFFTGLLTNIVTAVLGVAILWASGDWLIAQFAHTPWIAEQAQRYLGVFLWVVFLEAIGQCLGSYFNGCGRTKVPFLSYLIAIPLNVGVSYALIHGLYGLPALGVAGAAVGSAVAALARALFLGIGFMRMTSAFRGISGWRNGTLSHSMRRYLVFAMPIAGTFIGMFLSNNVCALIYAKMSVNQFAAMTLIQPWTLLGGTFATAWGMATGICVAQMLGRGTQGPELDGFLRTAWRGAAVAAVIVAVVFLGLCLYADVIYGNLEDETRAAIWSFLPVLLLLPFPRGSNLMCGHTLRAGGDTVYPMNIHLGAQWLFKVPLVALSVLVLNLSVTWVFAIALAEELVKFPFFHRRLFKGAWKHGPADE